MFPQKKALEEPLKLQITYGIFTPFSALMLLENLIP